MLSGTPEPACPGPITDEAHMEFQGCGIRMHLDNCDLPEPVGGDEDERSRHVAPSSWSCDWLPRPAVAG